MHPFRYRLYLLLKLPAAFFSGIKVKYADESKAIVSVPFRWFTKNPFKSTYFACLSMAAEMSTGILCMAHTYQKEPAISMLVTKIEGTFIKKANKKTLFTCEEGNLIEQTVKEAMASGKSQQVSCRTTGTSEEGELIAEFNVTWSFKVKAREV